MTRLPPKPDLAWKEDGTPVDERVGDVYFSRHDGLEETRAVFLAGCGLPQRWDGHDQFTIGELGFGTGLNFLATWQAWQQSQRGKRAWLHFVSFEGYPLDREEAARALASWPELEDLSQRLLAKWPVRAHGVQRLVWPGDHLTLTLHTGDIEEMLPGAVLRANAWFLDGFSPARNEDMWAPTLWPMVRQRCEEGAIAATFTVAGAVRRGLAEAGFAVEKKPGFGRKRERLEVRAGELPSRNPDPYGLRPLGTRAEHVRVVGAGIAGACAARVLMDRGVSVEVVDSAKNAAHAASGNPLALVMPRLDAGDTVQARLLLDAYIAARHFYAGLEGAHFSDVTHRPKDEKEAERIAKVLAEPPLGLENLEALAGGGQLHKGAFILEPHKLIPLLLEGAELHFEQTLEPEDLQDGVPTILAAGHEIRELLPWLEIEGRMGQVEFCRSDVDTPASALASGDYALASGKQRLWGATFERWNGGRIETHPGARDANMAALERLNPFWRQDARKAPAENRAGVRATTPDRLPLIGRVPDHERAMTVFDDVRHGRPAKANAPLSDNLLVSGGFGSRGFTWGPWAGEVLAAQLLGEPAPASEKSLQAVSPMRQILRSLKRGG
ncbi:tRNA (5-methylaminomethyl-2-thiouridine)(34)-methyltransferase MnmD [Henriciella sp.]|uniref:tRNA (5-methylaminomethyl-2-thiouridine)(34)-methyltransferase MnmD n=1 Tax=Henriciella sp. TaxID=1968823 RepID=UPI0026178F6D|nr:tRNA (5-methylaminomethyl-2-thiouridine)(34)-methyltransferase MnmD [Henriciella sp.]